MDDCKACVITISWLIWYSRWMDGGIDKEECTVVSNVSKFESSQIEVPLVCTILVPTTVYLTSTTLWKNIFLQKCPLSFFPEKTSSGLAAELIPNLRTSLLRNSQNCWLKPACILANISNDISPLTVRMLYNPISNQLRVMGSLSPSNQSTQIQNHCRTASVHLHLYITADRRRHNVAWYECHAFRAAPFLLNMQRNVSKHGLNIVWWRLPCRKVWK